MISTSQKEHLTYTAIGQSLIIVGAIAVIFSYVVPGFKTIDTNLNAANWAIKEYQETETNWLSFEKLWTILSSTKWKEELISIINTASPEEVKSVIRKEWSEKYLSWLKQAILGSDEDRRKLMQIKQKINSILPTLSPMSANIDEENITLKQYIKFIESKIIREFNLSSNIPLSLQWVSYWDTSKKVPKTIGTLSLSLDFTATNKDIMRFVEFINNSGDGELLENSWALSSDEVPGIMSNPLVTFESFSLKDPLDMDAPETENSGRATIKFYVRWSSKDDITFLTESVKSRKETLGKNIDNAVKQCKTNETICGNLSELEAFQFKFVEFNRSTQTINGTITIEKLSQQVTSLRTLEKQFEELVPTNSTNIN